MSQRRKSIDRFTIQEDIQLDELRRTEAVHVIIERCVTFRNTLQLVVEVDYDFTQWDVVENFHTVTRDVFLLDEFTTLTQAQGHDRANVVGSSDDRCTDERFLDVVNQGDFRHTGRIVHFLHLALLVVHLVRYVRHGSDYVHIELAVETFLYDFHMEQAQETATETEAQRYRRFWHESQRSIVQLQLFKRCTEVFVIFRINRIKTGKHHRLHFFETGDSLLTRTGNVGNGIPYLYFLRSLDTRNDITYVTGTELVTWYHVHLEDPDFVGIIFLAGIEELHLVTFADHTVFYLEISNDTTE